MKSIELGVFDCDIRIDCMDSQPESLLVANYGWFKRSLKDPQLQYRIDREPKSHRVLIMRDGVEPMVASDDGEFLLRFEKDMTVELQKLRRDLYFIHSAALEFARKALLLVAPSGGGKSMTTWGLLHEGFRYLSRRHHTFCPIGLCTSRSMHVPAEYLPGEVGAKPTPLIAVFFLELGFQPCVPGIEPIGKAEAAARLFVNSLNPLAHKGEGLDGVIAIAKNNFCFRLIIGDFSATCALVKNT